VEYKQEEYTLKHPHVSANAQQTFLAGPGEGLPLQAINLHFEGVVRVDGELLRYVAMFWRSRGASYQVPSV